MLEQGQDIRHHRFSDCAPTLTINLAVLGCKEWLNITLEHLNADAGIENVVLGYRYSAFLYGDHIRLYGAQLLVPQILAPYAAD